MRRLVSLLIFVVAVNSIWAYKIQMKDGYEITVPDSFIDTGDAFGKDMIFCGIDSVTHDVIMIKAIDKSDFDGEQVMDKADEIVFNLRNHVMTDSKSDGLFDIGKDYVIKTYRGIDDNKNLYTYTAYTYNYPYILLYKPASDTDGITALKNIASTVRDSDDSWWHKVWMLFSRSMGTILLAFLVSIVLIAATKSNVILLLTILVGAWLLSPAWGDWAVYLPSLGVYAFFMVIAKSQSLESVLTSMSDGI